MQVANEKFFAEKMLHGRPRFSASQLERGEKYNTKTPIFIAKGSAFVTFPSALTDVSSLLTDVCSLLADMGSLPHKKDLRFPKYSLAPRECGLASREYSLASRECGLCTK